MLKLFKIKIYKNLFIKKKKKKKKVNLIEPDC